MGATFDWQSCTCHFQSLAFSEVNFSKSWLLPKAILKLIIIEINIFDLIVKSSSKCSVPLFVQFSFHRIMFADQLIFLNHLVNFIDFGSMEFFHFVVLKPTTSFK